ncbi:MAG: cell division protein FtsZ [Bacteroidia bacterium]
MNQQEFPNQQPSLIPFDISKEQPSMIKVIGVGGGGSNAVNHMFRQGITGVDFIVCNTDAKALAISPVPVRIQLGPGLTQGMGAGAIPEVGKRAVIENIDELRTILGDNTRMCFITAGMGGGTGTGAAPIIAGLAKELGVLTVGIVTIPFAFEGRKRKLQAEAGIEEMKKNVDALLIICNDKLREIHGNLNLSVAFGHADDVLTVAAKSIAEIITNTMHISTDFADIQTVMKDSGVAIMGSATAEGDNRAIRAAEAALDSPLLNDNVIEGANYILLNITSGHSEVTMDEVGEINDFIQAQAGNSADIIMGIGKDPSLGDKVGVTVIATGFKTGEQKQIEIRKQTPEIIVHKLTEEPVKPEPVIVNETPVATTEEPVAEHTPDEPFVFIREEAIETKQEETIIDFTAEITPPATPAENGVFELEFPGEEETTVQPIHSEQTFTPPVAEVKEEQETIRHELYNTAPAQPLNTPAPSLTPEEEMYRHSRERIMRLREVSLRYNSPNGMADMEREPAYKRRNIKLDQTPASGDSNVSRYTLSMDETQNKPEIRTNNSFLHDRVD